MLSVVDIAKYLSFISYSLEKSTNSSKAFKLFINWAVFLCYGLGYTHDLEREVKPGPVCESHLLTSY